jgi:hypothetical protein
VTHPRRLSLLLVGAALTFAVGPPGCGGDDTEPPTTTTTTSIGGSGGASTSSTTSTGGTGGATTETGGTGGATTETGGTGGTTTAPAHAPLLAQGLSGSAIGKSQSFKMILAVGAPADPVHASSDNYQLQCVVDDQGSANQ